MKCIHLSTVREADVIKALRITNLSLLGKKHIEIMHSEN